MPPDNPWSVVENYCSGKKESLKTINVLSFKYVYGLNQNAIKCKLMRS